jgi:hypothetical protein
VIPCEAGESRSVVTVLVTRLPRRSKQDLNENSVRRWAKRRLVTLLVFHAAGRPMGDWRKRWDRACLRAGYATQDAETKKISAHKLRYDTRARVPERVAMEITGHKTRSAFDRYNIVSERISRTPGPDSQPTSRSSPPPPP